MVGVAAGGVKRGVFLCGELSLCPLFVADDLSGFAGLGLMRAEVNMANVLRTLALPLEMAKWSLTSLREKVVKIGAKVIAHGRYTIFQMAEVAVPRDLFRRILEMINDLRCRQVERC